MNDGLKASEREAIRGVLAQFPAIQKAVLFGSRATGTYSPASDIDLALYGDSLTLSDEFRIAARIEDIGLPLRVDLVRYATITSEALLSHIHRDGKFFYEVKGGREKVGSGNSGMSSEWPTLSLGELGVTLIDCDHRTPPAAESGYPYVAIPQLRQGRIDLTDVRRITREHFSEWTRKAKPQANDVVLSRRCNPGETAFVPPGLEFALGQNLVLLRANEEKVDPPFLRWLVRGPEWWEQISKFLNVGAVFDSLRCADVPKFELRVPPIKEQRAIAHILGTLDDKIELNQRVNETLEAIARALFKSWFVDFDPVRAKAEGRAPGLPKPLADLFPDSFEDSELGEIPKGWQAGPLGRFIKVGLGGAWGDDSESSRASLAVRCLRGIDCHDLAEGRIPEVPIRWISPGQAAARQLVDGTILVEGSGSFCGRSLLWRATYGELLGGSTCYSNFCRRLDPLCTPAQATLCWLQMRQAYRNGELQAFRTGTAFPNFDIHGALGNLIVVVPTQPVADAFGKFFNLSQRLDLMTQARTLAALRDTLLPRLISGELRVKDAERFLDDRGL